MKAKTIIKDLVEAIEEDCWFEVKGSYFKPLVKYIDKQDKEIDRLNGIFKALKEEMKKTERISIDDYVSIINHEKEMLKILNEVEVDKE